MNKILLNFTAYIDNLCEDYKIFLYSTFFQQINNFANNKHLNIKVSFSKPLTIHNLQLYLGTVGWALLHLKLELHIIRLSIQN